jgi:hypothetical protein
VHKTKTITVLAAAVGATVSLAACSHASGTSVREQNAAVATHAAVRPTNHASTLIDCPQRYAAWENGPANKIITAVHAVVTSSTGRNIRVQEAALKNAVSTVDSAAKYPIPECADPKGYWNALLMHVNAAAESFQSAGTSSSVKVALIAAPQLERDLGTELKQTAAVRE